MANGTLLPVDPRGRHAWFAEMLSELDSSISEAEWKALTQADPRLLHRAFHGLHDFVAMLSEEVAVMHSLFTDLARLLQTLHAQRDEALAERDSAVSSLQDAYLRGLLTREEERIENWTAFGIADGFSLDWLREVLVAAGAAEAADKVAWVTQGLGDIVELAGLHRQRHAAQPVDSDDDTSEL